MSTRASVQLSKDSRELIIAYLTSRYKDFPMQEVRQRLEKIDKALQLESDKRKEYRGKDSDYFADTEIPVARAPISKVGNFLIDLFVGNKIFEAVSPDPKNKEGVVQFNAVIEENSRTSNWGREVILAMRDVSKYPWAAISCNWHSEEVLSIAEAAVETNATSPTSGAEVTSTIRSGNSLKRLDPYNTFYDTSVPINQLHVRGEFSATIDRVSQIDLYKTISDIKASGGIVMEESSIWGRANSSPEHHYTPDIQPEFDNETRARGWGAFFEMSPKAKSNKMKMLGKGARYEKVTLNVRIIPSMFGMKVPAADKLQIWKFVIINWDTVLFAERQSNAHSYLPDVYAQTNEEGIGVQSKSTAELIIPIQNLSTHIHDAHLAGLKRELVDRALYNSARIDQAYMDEDNPTAKIPVTPSLVQGDTLDNAYRPIPFENRSASNRYNELQYLDQISERTVGLNRPQQGQFQKGNKTLGEFSEVMSNADDDLRTMAKLVHSTMLIPIKTMIKTNMLQYQLPTLITNDEGTQTTVSPTALRKTALTFKLADGLVDKSQMLDLPTANTLLNLVLSVPALQQKYDLSKLVDHTMSSVGFNTEQFNNGGIGGPAPEGQQQAPPTSPQGAPPNAG